MQDISWVGYLAYSYGSSGWFFLLFPATFAFLGFASAPTTFATAASLSALASASALAPTSGLTPIPILALAATVTSTSIFALFPIFALLAILTLFPILAPTVTSSLTFTSRLAHTSSPTSTPPRTGTRCRTFCSRAWCWLRSNRCYCRTRCSGTCGCGTSCSGTWWSGRMFTITNFSLCEQMSETITSHYKLLSVYPTWRFRWIDKYKKLMSIVGLTLCLFEFQ